MDYSILEEIGLTKSEIKVYIALIDLGSSTIGPIIKKSGVASSKIYELLNKLLEKGLVTTHTESGTKYFKAVNPHRLRDYLEEKEKELKEKEKELNKFIPSLLLKFNEKTQETEVEVFKGYRGIETVFKDMIRELKKGDEFLVIGGGDKPSGNKRTKLFFEKIHKERAKKKITLKIIFSKARKDFYKQMSISPYTQAKYLKYGTPSTVNIYKDTTILLVMSPVPAAIRIRNNLITDSYKKYFEEMWRLAER